MTVRHRICADQLQVLVPLPVDVYDAENRLLFRRGNLIANEAQLERLLNEGLFSDQPIEGPVACATRPKAGVSVYAEMVAAAATLETLCRAPEAYPGFVAAIDYLASALRTACALDPDAALAHIMFAREAAYPIRQSFNTAILTALLVERISNDGARKQAAVCAALTANLTIHAVQEALYRQQAVTGEQRKLIARHPEACADRLLSLGVQDTTWLALVRQHHESVDGSGYPRGLAGAAVLREAQVIGLADRYCETVTERAYRQAVAPEVAIRQIRMRSGTAIDAEFIEELTHWIGLYPPGTVVELVNREVGVVTRRLHDPKHPVICAIASPDLQPFESPRTGATASQSQFAIGYVLPRDTIKFAIDPEMLWPRSSRNETAGARSSLANNASSARGKARSAPQGVRQTARDVAG